LSLRRARNLQTSHLAVLAALSLGACTVDIPQAAAPEGDVATDALDDVTDNDATAAADVVDGGASDAKSGVDTGLDAAEDATHASQKDGGGDHLDTATDPDTHAIADATWTPDGTTWPDSLVSPDGTWTPDMTVQPEIIGAPDSTTAPDSGPKPDAGGSDGIVLPDGQSTSSCVNRCGKYNKGAKCQCDGSCAQYKDCCPDYATLCLKGCGDGKCIAPETTLTCPKDCGQPPKCGDFKCDVGEDASNCSIDCSKVSGCGNGVCDPDKEHPLNCGQDCGVVTTKCTAATCQPEIKACAADKACAGAAFIEVLVACYVKHNCTDLSCATATCSDEAALCLKHAECKSVGAKLAAANCYDYACFEKVAPKAWVAKYQCGKSKCSWPK